LEKTAFMRACRDGGHAIEQALVELDRSLFAALFRDCVRTVRDGETARDLVQETFIKVWQRCAQFRGSSELLPWIKSILRRATLDWLRRNRPAEPIEENGQTSAEVERRIDELSMSELATPDADSTRHELAECFQRCWKRFETAHPAHAAVMTWIVHDGLTNEEIAQLLERSPGATREFISQCRKRARVHFAEWYELAFGIGVQ
jgi:RNA polymerase sigma factor (sigma-70 family)